MRQVGGLHAVREVVKVRPRSIKRALFKDGWKQSKELTELATELKTIGIKVEVVPPSVLDKVLKGHQGVLVETQESPEMNRPKWDNDERQMLLALDGIEDPQNLGAILRTAWLMQVDGVFLPKGRSSPLTAAACKTASGGAEHVPIEVHPNLAAPLNILKGKDFWVFGLSAEGSKSLWDVRIPEKIVWVIGGEATGLRPGTSKLCDEQVFLPQCDAQASYNASVAAALAIAETRRRWSVEGHGLTLGKSQ